MPPSSSSPVAAPGEGAVDVFLAVQGKRAGKVRGEATAVDHKDEISIQGWHWGVTASSALGASNASARRSYKNLTVSKRVDCSTTALLSMLATNDEIKEARLCMRKAGEGQRDFFKITLYNARVTSLDVTCDSTGMMSETATFSFNRVQVEYEIQQASGQRGSGFNFVDEILPV
jgi:type VI secretion system secreted protein Hcp